MSFKQFLEEGRDAPLYHSTPPNNLALICEKNCIQDNTTHLKSKLYDRVGGDGYKDGESKNRTVCGISLTRDKNSAKKWHTSNGTYLVLDQRKLAQTHKIIPFNYFRSITKNHPNAEFEEFIIGSIKNLNRYLTKIVYVRTDDLDFNNETDIITNYCKKYKIQLEIKDMVS
jgi:hypothetical protein